MASPDDTQPTPLPSTGRRSAVAEGAGGGSPSDPSAQQHLADDIVAIRRRLSWLTVAVFLVALTLLLFVAAVLSKEIDFHYGESKLIAGACTGGVAMGFLFGWLARRAC